MHAVIAHFLYVKELNQLFSVECCGTKLSTHLFIIVKSSWLFIELDKKTSNVFRSFQSKTKAVRMFNVYNDKSL